MSRSIFIEKTNPNGLLAGLFCPLKLQWDPDLNVSAHPQMPYLLSSFHTKPLSGKMLPKIIFLYVIFEICTGPFLRLLRFRGNFWGWGGQILKLIWFKKLNIIKSIWVLDLMKIPTAWTINDVLIYPYLFIILVDPYPFRAIIDQNHKRVCRAVCIDQDVIDGPCCRFWFR